MATQESKIKQPIKTAIIQSANCGNEISRALFSLICEFLMEIKNKNTQTQDKK
jgi:hypothetical protein